MRHPRYHPNFPADDAEMHALRCYRMSALRCRDTWPGQSNHAAPTRLRLRWR